MTQEQKQIKNWMIAFGQETPEKPKIPSLEVRKLRAKLILEEAFEAIYALGFDICLSEARRLLFEELLFLPNETGMSLSHISDGCEDMKVVVEGTLVACGLCQPPKRLSINELDKIINEPNNPRVVVNKANADPLFDEVMRSNWTKLWTSIEIEEVFILAREYDYKKGWNEEANLFCEQVFIHQVTGETKWLVKDKDGKVIKSPSYSPANLQPIIDAL